MPANCLPVFYPSDDDIRYHDHFKGEFSKVFVAFNPFIRVQEHSQRDLSCWLPDEVLRAAKRLGPDSGVSWREVAEYCQFPSAKHVNRALRWTGSRRLVPEFANEAEARTMIQTCQSHGILIPDEGRFSPPLELAIGRFMTALDLQNVLGARHFGSDPKCMKVSEFLNPESDCCPEICAKDTSVYIAIYIDYHHALICQTETSWKKANPAKYFEGFQADENTCDLWGLLFD